ncbi:hypothetical protein RND81_03G043500 [Saponaria officinalis]|uniref:Uncharacterized protein n=1 Tax=Saponaria officinalis TaxID=3572 RepID=A0AAW1M7J7_SAPOF
MLPALFFIMLSTFHKCTSEVQISFHYVSFIWPSRFCRTKNCTNSAPPYFTIHGLWPSRSNNTSIVDCQGPIRNYGEIQPLVPRLTLYWPSYTHRRTLSWRHEWNHHGKCSRLTLARYFRAGLYLLNFRSDLLDALHNAGINERSSDGNQYTIFNYLTALRNRFRHEVQLRCRDDLNGVIFLTGVNLCVDLNYHVISCPIYTWLRFMEQ